MKAVIIVLNMSQKKKPQFYSTYYSILLDLVQVFQ